MRIMRLSEKVVAVTGAAGGIGSAICESVLDNGGTLILTDRDTERGTELAQRLSARGQSVTFLAHDVCDQASWAAVLAEIDRAYGRMDILVNNAGGAAVFESIGGTGLDQWNACLALNLTSVFLGCRLSRPYLALDGGGAIVNIGSNTSLRAMTGNSAYSTAKAALAHFSRLAAMEFVADRIRVNTVHPGITRTPLSEPYFADMHFRASVLDPIPMGRPAEPSEIATAVVYLASDEASYMTGAEVTVDGGHSARF
jgi:NAD(P)-dependent dehydrogenase (short-subunit alcohol dehydrogenase family)